MVDSEWTPPRAKPNNEPFTKGPPDPFKFDFQTAELLLGQLGKEFGLVSVTMKDFVEQMKAKYNAGVRDAAAHARKHMIRDIEMQSALIIACGEAAGLRDVGFKAPEVIVGAIQELARTARAAEKPLAIRSRSRQAADLWREGKAPIDERTEAHGPALPPVPAIAGGAVGGSDPTPRAKQGQGPQARPEYAEIRAMCQSMYPVLASLGVTLGAIEQRVYELDREHG